MHTSTIVQTDTHEPQRVYSALCAVFVCAYCARNWKTNTHFSIAYFTRYFLQSVCANVCMLLRKNGYTSIYLERVHKPLEGAHREWLSLSSSRVMCSPKTIYIIGTPVTRIYTPPQSLHITHTLDIHITHVDILILYRCAQRLIWDAPKTICTLRPCEQTYKYESNICIELYIIFYTMF